MRSCAQRWGLVTVLLGLFGASAYAAQFPFQNPSLPMEQRVADLVGRLTPEEKISQMTMTAAAIPAAGYSRIHLVERGSAWRGTIRLRHRLSAGDWPRRHLGYHTDAFGRRHRFHRSARQIRRRHRAWQPSHLLWPDDMVSEYQYLSRSRDGAADRRPTERILISPPAWAWPLSPGCKGTIRSI